MMCAKVSELDEDGPPIHGCPKCGDKHVPADLDDAVDIHITVHELRILCMWADSYAKAIGMERPMRVILDRLGTQTSVALTLGQEMADVRAYLAENEPQAIMTIYRNGKLTDE